MEKAVRKGAWIQVEGRIWEARPLVRLGNKWILTIPRAVVDLLCYVQDNKPWVLWKVEDGVIMVRPLLREYLESGPVEGGEEEVPEEDPNGIDQA